MKRDQSIVRAVWRSASGGVLFEYVILSVCVIVPLLTGASFLSSPGGPITITPQENRAVFTGTMVVDNNREDYGLLGNEYVNWVRRVMAGIALPIP